MGWYINYEIDFENTIEWLDEKTKKSLKDFDCEIIYLQNCCIICLYSH